MAFKGQAELVVIVGLLVIIAVVIVSQMNLFMPVAETPDVRAVRESVEGLIRTAALDTISTMSERGGYLFLSDYQLGSAALNGKDVPYWQYAGQVTYPDKSSNFQAGVQAYLEAHKDSMATALTNVTIGDPVVGTPVFSDDKITVSVTMPTTYRDIPLAQPYTVTVDTHFSELYEFSKGFAVYEANNRPFEYYTLSSMALSPLENGHHVIPMYEILVGCGDHIFASSWDVIPEVEKTIRKTLAHTYMPGKVPLNTIRTSASPKYSLVPINGREYQDLQISFMLPDDFGLDPTSFRMSPDPATGVAEPIPMLGECIGNEPVAVSYSMSYPVIVRALDPETGSIFQFAVQVDISGNAPREWAVASSEEEDLQAEVCSDPSCILELSVQDSSGRPIEAASVSFMGCFLGRTDGSGYLATLAPCGSGTLYVYKREYGEYLDSRTSAQLDDTVTLYRKPVVNLLLYEVMVQDQGGGKYMVYYGDISPIGGKRAYLTFRSEENFKEYAYYSGASSLTLSMLPAGNYYVSGTLSSTDFMQLLGAFGYPFTITEDTSTLHIYIPTTPSLASMTDEMEMRQKAAELSRVLYECGIGPVSDTGYTQEEACAVTL
jgi:hypothetical protein